MTTTGEVLKPCPFCGGKAETRLAHDGWCVECQSCFVQAAHDLIEDKSIRAWNRRAPQGNAAQERRAALEDAIDACDEEYLIGPSTSADDVAYNMAIDDVKDRIEKLIAAPSNKEVER